MGFVSRNRSFLLLWCGQVLSQSGGRAGQIALVWWAVNLHPEGAGRRVGMIFVAAALPVVLFVRWIGGFIDDSRSRRVLVGADAAASVTWLSLAGCAAAGLISFPVACAGVFVAATLQALLDPTLNRSVAEVVEIDDVERGVALLASTTSIANFAGAAGGAALIGVLGTAGVLAVVSLGYGISSLLSARVRFPFARAAGGVEGSAAGWSLLEPFPLVKTVLVGFGAVNFFATPTLVVLPLYVSQALGGDARVLGSLEACLWLGLLGGTALAGAWKSGDAVLGIGAGCLAVMSLSLWVPGLVVSIGAYGVALAAMGAALGVNNVKFVAFFQREIPQALKGRFFALMSAVVGATFPVAHLLFGVLGDLVSPPALCRVQGAGVALVAGYFAWLAWRAGEWRWGHGVPQSG